MKFKKYTEKIYNNPIEQVLYGRGIDDIDAWLNADMSNVAHWSKLDNIERAANLIHDTIVNNEDVFMVVD